MRASIRPSFLRRATQPSNFRIAASRFESIRPFHSPPTLSSPSTIPHHRPPLQRPWQHARFVRHSTDLAAPSTPSRQKPPTSSSPTATQPAYEIYFTCKPCSHRSGPHRVTKQGFHTGTTLITCPSCKNRHIVSDHLKIFTDEGGDLADIMKRHGGKLKKGKLGIRQGQLVGNEGEEEIEFWEDGTETTHDSWEPQSNTQ